MLMISSRIAGHAAEKSSMRRRSEKLRRALTLNYQSNAGQHSGRCLLSKYVWVSHCRMVLDCQNQVFWHSRVTPTVTAVPQLLLSWDLVEGALVQLSVLGAEVTGATILVTVLILRALHGMSMVLQHQYIPYMNAITGTLLLLSLLVAAQRWLFQIWKHRRQVSVCPLSLSSHISKHIDRNCPSKRICRGSNALSQRLQTYHLVLRTYKLSLHKFWTFMA